MSRRPLLQRLAEFCVRRPWPVLILALAATLASLAIAFGGLRLKSSNLDLIDAELPEVVDFTRFAEEFGTPNVLVVVLEGGEVDALHEAADRLGPALAAVPGVRRVLDRLPVEDELLREWDLDRHLLSDDAHMLFIFVQPDDPHSAAETIAHFVEGVRDAIDAARLERLGVRVGLTGLPQYAIDDRDIIRHDISVLSIVSLVLVLLLFAVGFRSIWRPLLAVVALLVAVLVTLALVAIYPGYLTLLSAFFAMILFGLGVDYGIHIVHHVEQLVAGGACEREAVPAAIGALSGSLITAAATTSGAFFGMTFSGFKGFAELGQVAGAGVLLCLLSMCSILPALLVVVHPERRKSARRASSRIARILSALQHPAPAAIFAAAALLALLVPAPAFDSDYLNLQPHDSDAVRLERAMVERSDLSPQFAIFTVDSAADAAALSDRLLGDETVGEVQSIADLELIREDAESWLPPDYLSAFRSDGGRYAVYAYPAGDVWSPDSQRAFVERMKAVDEHVTGMPILGRFMVERSRRAMAVTSWIAIAILTGCVLLSFRDPRPALLALLPTLLTLASMNALMRLCGISFNPLNVMALPILLGIAVDDGVYIVHRFLQERGDLDATLAGTGRSVLFTSLTTIAAFGSLAFTSHRGLRSFALAVSLGVAAALVLTVGVLPGLLRLVRGWLIRDATSKPPLDVTTGGGAEAGSAG